MTGLNVSSSFIDDLCRNLKNSLELNDNLHAKASAAARNSDGTVNLDGSVWGAIMKAHTSNLKAHKTVLEGILAATQMGGSKDSTVQELRQLCHNAELVLTGVRRVKAVLIAEKILSPDMDGEIWPTTTEETQASANTTPTRSDDTRHAELTTENTATSRPSSSPSSGKRKRSSSGAQPRRKIPKLIEAPDTSVDTGPTISTRSSMDDIRPTMAAEFYDINDEVNAALKEAAETRAARRRKEESDIDKRKRESTGSLVTIGDASEQKTSPRTSGRTPAKKKRKLGSTSAPKGGSVEDEGGQRQGTLKGKRRGSDVAFGREEPDSAVKRLRTRMQHG